MKHIILLSVFGFAATIFLLNCGKSNSVTQNTDNPSVQFEEHLPEKSGFKFSNLLDENTLVNPFNYINAYNGGGVAIGDINNDGLQDIFMTGNMVSSKLFLNKGNFKFEDITEKAGTATTGWCVGVSMADINNDGWLDIYVCRSYHDEPAQALRENLLFINNQDGTFSEKAAEYGVNDGNYSIASSFFDYDKDGDLDLIVANHPRFRLVSLSTHYNYWKNPVMEYSSRLFRNDEGKFKDVTVESGLLSYGFCLGLVTSDLDQDGWPDIFISVDHDEPDMVMHNNGDGTFSNITETALKENSRSSMGIDAGDLNHDIYPDVLVVEMLSEDHFREKVSMGMQTVDRFEYLTDSLKFKYYQMRNFLHFNNGNNTFSDIGQLAGIHRTDWSWAGLFMDADNDGWQDIFVTNGYFRDIYDKDKSKPFDSIMMTLGNDMVTKNRLASEFARSCSQTPIPNYLFKNRGDLTFEKYTSKAGLDKPTISNGAAYGDLDNDGDLDLVINNLGSPSMLYENKLSGANYLRFKLAHVPGKTGVGAKVILTDNGETQMRELLTTRGFLSGSENIIHFGLGNISQVEKVEIIWPDGKTQTLKNISANQVVTIKYNDADGFYTRPVNEGFVQELTPQETGIDFVQSENFYNDYSDQVLLPHKMSEQGPFLSKGDVDGDGLSDLFIGAPEGQAAGLYVQNPAGKFDKKNIPAFEKDKKFEDAGSAFFDADGDGDLDLLVASGGYEYDINSEKYQPRLYLNNGKGDFIKSENKFPVWKNSASVVRPVDIDMDGDIDVLIGGRLAPKSYPQSGTSGLFINDGEGNFTESINTIADGLINTGMVKDALWMDVNNDQKPDLIIAGEWMAISFWINHDGKLINETEKYLPASPIGWWNCIEMADLDGNGLMDLVVGNLGLNYKYKASKEKPFTIYGKDFDKSGSQDIVLATYYDDTVYPVRGRSCSSEQIPDLKKKFPTFTEYARADVNAVYGEELNTAIQYNATQFASVILYQEKPGLFSMVELPLECQFAPINGVVVLDINNDGKNDLIIGGNLYQSEIETGRADAGTGRVLLNKGNKNWHPLEVYESGLYMANDVKSILYFEMGSTKKPAIVVGNNREKCQVFNIDKTVL